MTAVQSVMSADRVVVLVGGRVEESGTPEQLAAGRGWFARNFFSQICHMDIHTMD